MGASSWHYFVPFQSDILKALQELLHRPNPIPNPQSVIDLPLSAFFGPAQTSEGILVLIGGRVSSR
jgi:hypothetical protein